MYSLESRPSTRLLLKILILGVILYVVYNFVQDSLAEVRRTQKEIDVSFRKLVEERHALYVTKMEAMQTEIAVQSAATSQRVNTLIQGLDVEVPLMDASIPPYGHRIAKKSNSLRSDPFGEDPNLVPFDGMGLPILTDEQVNYYLHNFHAEDPRAKLPDYEGDLCGYRHPKSGCPDCYMVRHVADVKDMFATFKRNRHRQSHIQLIQWPVIRNSSTTKYHLLGRPEVQFQMPEFMVPPGCRPGKFGKPTVFKIQPATQLPDLESAKMPFALRIKNGILNSRGTVYVKEHNATIIGASCLHYVPTQTQHGVPKAIYDRVLVLSQYWGYGPYHWLVECLPRIMLFTHLLQDPTVMVHIPLMYDQSEGGYNINVPSVVKATMEFLGVPRSRLVFGEIMGKEVYFPAQGTCQYSDPVRSPWLGAYLQHLLRQRVGDRMLPATTHPSEGKGHVLFIKRSGKRALAQHDKFVAKVMEKFPGHKMAIYGDDPPPSFQETLLLFYNADVIAAPHGAGEANMLGSRPGTRIFEWKVNDYWVGSCFQMLAWNLGHNWWGYSSIANNRDNAISVTDREIDVAAKRIRGMFENEGLRVIDTR